MTISAPQHDSADDLRVAADTADSAEDASALVEDEEESPENLTKRAWITVIMFAAFIVMTSGCMINLMLR